jgi:ADP-heptose:LPS heptosyltransferase/GT2 family glycosyltransferase
MGDVVMALPVLRAFRRAHPLDRIHFLAQPKYHPVLKGNRDVDFVRPLGTLKGTPGHVDLADFRRRPWAARWRHVVDAMGDACGVEIQDRAYHMVIPGDDARWAENEAAALGQFAVMHASSAMDSKDWPIERFGTLAGRLIGELSLRVVQIGANEDAQVACPGVVDRRGALSITQSAALMARAQLFVGVDSGPMHLSRAAREVPAVVLWGAGSPVTTGLPGGRVANLDPVRWCGHGGRPCHSRCDWTSKCVSEIPEEDAFRACARVTGRAPEGPEISIILVNWNSWAKSTHPMVSRIDRTLRDERVELILIDNGSPADEQHAIRWLSRPYPVKRAIWPSNRGLPAAWNEASRLASGRILAFMNTDLDLEPGWASFAIDFFRRNPAADVLGLSLNEPPMAFGAGLSREKLPLEKGRTTRCHHMIGSCFLARREVLDRVGDFDLRFTPGYCEDTDWFMRASLMGAQVWHHAGFVTHRGHEVTVNINRTDLRPIIARNDAYFEGKWAGAEPSKLPEAAPAERVAEVVA